jgi:hypothetical protein
MNGNGQSDETFARRSDSLMVPISTVSDFPHASRALDGGVSLGVNLFLRQYMIIIKASYLN